MSGRRTVAAWWRDSVGSCFLPEHVVVVGSDLREGRQIDAVAGEGETLGARGSGGLAGKVGIGIGVDGDLLHTLGRLEGLDAVGAVAAPAGHAVHFRNAQGGLDALGNSDVRLH